VSCRPETEAIRDDQMAQLYDEIGVGYRNSRRPDPRIATVIRDALGQADTLVNVGAGAGSYEPSDRPTVAVEPSMTMIRQRRASGAPVVQASATELRSGTPPSRQRSPSSRCITGPTAPAVSLSWRASPRAALWSSPGILRPRASGWSTTTSPRSLRSIAECSRHRGVQAGTWSHRGRHALDSPRLRRRLPRSVLATSACLPGCGRPRRHLDVLQDPRLGAGLARLRHDLEDGTWERRYESLLSRSEIDIGYRLFISNILRAGQLQVQRP